MRKEHLVVISVVSMSVLPDGSDAMENSNTQITVGADSIEELDKMVKSLNSAVQTAVGNLKRKG